MQHFQICCSDRVVTLTIVRSVTADDALAAARRLFEAGDRVEMGVLSDSLGVNRATLYRWVGSRDALLATLLWERMERGLGGAERRAAEAGLHGTARLGALLSGLFAGAGRRSPVRRLVDDEPTAAMRVMTKGTVHENLIAWFATVIDEEAAAGHIAPRYPSPQIAELVVKTGEAVFWFDVASGRGLDQANMAVLLEALCSPPVPD